MKRTVSFFAIALILTGTALSQPKWSFSLQGSYSMPVSDLKGTLPDTLNSAGTIDFTTERSYYTTKGFGIGGVAKYSADTSGNARITGSFYYNGFSQSKDYSRPSGITTYSNRINMISLIAGAEYDFRPKEKVNPFVSLELAANFFSGKIEASGDTTIHITRKSETRFGVNANAGIDVKINKGISLLFGAKYCMDNLFGKSYETVTTTTANKDTNPTSGGTTVYELPLNDGDHGSLQSLSIIHVQIYAGISFNIGSVKEKGNSK